MSRSIVEYCSKNSYELVGFGFRGRPLLQGSGGGVVCNETGEHSSFNQCGEMSKIIVNATVISYI